MSGPQPAEFSRAYRGYFLTLTALITAFAAVDRVALLTVGQAISDDMGLSDFEFGLVSGLAFAAVYLFAGLPLARLADVGNRVKLISAAIGIWSIFALLSGLARTFAQLMFCRVVIGIGEAGVQPPAVAIVSDLYPAHRRGTALALLSIGMPAGMLVGAIGAGYLADAYSWRAVFLILGFPGMALAVIAWFTLRDPPRGLSEGGAKSGAASDIRLGPALRQLSGRKSFRHIVVGLGLTYFAAAGIGSFLPQYFGRAFSLSLGQTGLLFGLTAAASNLTGYILGGVGVDRITRRDRRWYAWLPALGLIVAAPLYILSFRIGNSILATGVLVAAGMILFLHYVPTQTALQNMVAPNMRATAAFIFFFIISMLGYGIGPALLGILSDVFAARAFGPGDYAASCLGASPTQAMARLCTESSLIGIRGAMTAMSFLFLWAGVHFLLAARTIRGDLDLAHGA